MFVDASHRRRTTSNVHLSTACTTQAEGSDALSFEQPGCCVVRLCDLKRAPSEKQAATDAAARHGTARRPQATQQQLGWSKLAIFLGSAIESATRTRGAFTETRGHTIYSSLLAFRTQLAHGVGGVGGSVIIRVGAEQPRNLHEKHVKRCVLCETRGCRASPCTLAAQNASRNLGEVVQAQATGAGSQERRFGSSSSPHGPR